MIFRSYPGGLIALHCCVLTFLALYIFPRALGYLAALFEMVVENMVVLQLFFMLPKTRQSSLSAKQSQSQRV